MDNSTPFRTFGTMLDCSRNAVPNLHTLKKWVDLTASLGYNTLLLYIEDTYEVPDEPYFGYMRGRYTQAELREIDVYARERGMTIMPCIQTLAHLYAIKRWPEYWPHFDTDDILLAGDERVYTLIDHMFRSLAASLSCRTIHLGMDEAEMFARGRYYNQHGDCNRSQALLTHLQRVCEIGETYGFRFLIWSDMFFKLATGGQYYAKNAQIDESVREKIPANVELVYWDYYSADEAHYDGMIEAHQKLKPGTWFAGGLWKWTGYAPHKGYSMKITKAALASCREHGVQDVFLTMWGDDGGECSPFTLLPSLFYASELAKGETNDETIKVHFAQRFGAAFDDFMQLDLPGTRNGLDDNVRNLDKFLLYNDPFMGMMDKTALPGEGAQFGACAERLEALQTLPEWGYLFETLGALCRVLEIKAELGVRIHEAYRTGDKTALCAMLTELDETLVRLERFHDAYQAQWMQENKPHGFDVQDIRLGGLMQRVKTCRARLEDYCAGRLDRLEELETKQLDFFDHGKRCAEPVATHWGQIATANIVYMTMLW